MTQSHKQPDKARRAPVKDKPIGDSKAGGEAPARRFAERLFQSGYGQKGDVDRAPFEGHPGHDENSARPRHRPPEPGTSGQHGQRPKRGRGPT
jgi:hypothetical protein